MIRRNTPPEAAAAPNQLNRFQRLLIALVVRIPRDAHLHWRAWRAWFVGKIASPVRIVDGSYYLGRDGYWWYVGEMTLLSNYDNLTRAAKRQYRNWLYELLSDSALIGRHFHLMGMADYLDPSKFVGRWRQNLVPGVDEDTRRLHEDDLQRRLANLSGDNAYRERRVYLAMRLREPRSLIQLIISRLQILLGYDELLVHGEPAKRFGRQVEVLQNLVESRHLGQLHTLTQAETFRLIMRSILRGQDDLPNLGYPQDKPVGKISALKRLRQDMAYDEGDHLVVKWLGRKSLVSYMAIAELPRRLPSPGAEFLFQSGPDGEPLEFSVRVRTRTSQDLLVEAKRSQRLADENRKALVKSGGDEDVAEIDRTMWVIDDMRQAGRNGQGWLELEGFIIASADSEDELNRIRNHVTAWGSEYDRGIYYDADPAYQAEMRASTLPGSNTSYRQHVLELSIGALAKSGLGVSSRYGNGGALRGVVRGRELYPFLWSHSRALLTKKEGGDTSVLQVVIGPLGSGKTHYLLESAVADALDGYIVILDEGKGDIRNLGQIPGLPAERILRRNLLDFPGILNPGMLGQTRNEKEAFITQFFIAACREWRETYRAPLYKAINEELERSLERPELLRIIDELWRNEDGRFGDTAKDLAGSVRGLTLLDSAKIFFGTEHAWHDLASVLRPGHILLFSYGELRAPDDRDSRSKIDWTDEELVGVLARRWSNFLYYQLGENADHAVHVLKDESAKDTKLGGQGFIEDTARMGRSKNTLITIANQSIRGINPVIFPFVAAWVFFRQDDKTAAMMALECLGYVLGDKPSDEEKAEYQEQLEELMGLGPVNDPERLGEAMVKIHPHNQVAVVQFGEYYLGGAFVSNQRERAQQAAARMQDAPAAEEPYVLFRQYSRETAIEGLVRIGVPLDELPDEEVNHWLDLATRDLPMDQSVGLTRLSGQVARVEFLPGSSDDPLTRELARLLR